MDRCLACNSADLRPITARQRRAYRYVLLGLVLTFLGAVMLVAGVGASALWIGVVIVGVAIVVIDLVIGRRGSSHLDVQTP